MIEISITLHDQEDAENLALVVSQLLDDFDEYVILPRLRRHFDEVR